MNRVVLVLAAFAAMEPVAYLLHRFVMHGTRAGASWHRSHHQVRQATFERNDLYPVVLAGLTVLVVAAGTAWHPVDSLVWVGAGVTLYGGGYLFVHDVYIHRRVPSFTAVIRPLERVREAHRIHHLWSGEPYGFLFPIVPRALKTRAREVTRDPLVHQTP